MGGRVGDGVFARADFPLAPGSNNLEARIERHNGQLETHLVVAFAGGAMGNRIRTGLVGNFHQVFGNQRTGHGGSEQVFALIDRPGFEHGEEIVGGEFLTQVADDELAGA